LDKVTSIGQYAFSGCTKLNGSLTLPNVESIGNYAFQGCTSLTGVSLGSVESIGTNAFSGCTFTRVTFTQVTGNANVFQGAGANVSNCALELAAGQTGVTALNSQLKWAGVVWKSIKVGGVQYTTVGNEVCELENGLPVKTIDGTRYVVIDGEADADVTRGVITTAYSNNYENFCVVNNLKQEPRLQNKSSVALALSNSDYDTGSITLMVKDAKTIGEKAFYECDRLKEVSLPAATSIEKYAFASCYYVDHITVGSIGSGNIAIGRNAFGNCGLHTINHTTNGTLIFRQPVTSITGSGGLGLYETSQWKLTLANGQQHMDENDSYDVLTPNGENVATATSSDIREKRKWAGEVWKSIMVTNGSN
jgi:hypothetical protein